MTIQFLKYIVSVSEIGSITEAARQLHISQPSLSAAIKEAEMRKTMDEMGLVFTELFQAAPHVFLRARHPLANREYVTLDELKPYPRLNFLQGSYESADFSEEPFSTEPSEKEIRVSDRAAIVNLMIGLDGYTISSGIFPRYLQGSEIVSVPLHEKETLRIGYVLCKGQSLSDMAKIYIEALRKFNPARV